MYANKLLVQEQNQKELEILKAIDRLPAELNNSLKQNFHLVRDYLDLGRRGPELAE